MSTSVISYFASLLAATSVAIPAKDDSSMGPLFIVVIIILVIWALYNVADDTKTNSSSKPDSLDKHVSSSPTLTNRHYSHTKSNSIKKSTGFSTEKRTHISSVKLGDEQQRIFDLMDTTNNNMFITGKAGTGKSVLLQYFVHHTDKQVAVVAPTGVAALNVGGQTIHSFFALSTEIQNSDDQEAVADGLGYKRREVLNGIDALIIDEISMVSADIMNMIDAKLKLARHNRLPFGGCQIIAFGDLYQLPPVVRSGQASRYIEDRYGTVYFFGADEIRKRPFRVIELQHVYRQKDPEFIKVLDRVRIGQVDNALLDDINACCVLPPADEQYITLTGDNATANSINMTKLQAIDSQEYIYDGEVSGDIKQSSMPTDLHLHLKVGAHVMMIKNDYTDNSSDNKEQKARWVNGTLGIISYLDNDSIKVRINGVEHWVYKRTWEKYQYTYDSIAKKLTQKVVATFTQHPIKLAYAITIHKSQGQTYDAVKVDLSKGAFATGQTYTALSRCRSIESLYLAKPLKKSDIMVNQEIVKYMSSTNSPSSNT